MYILVWALAIFIGAGLSYAIVEILIKMSNDLGDSKAEFKDFSKADLMMIEKKDNVKKKDMDSLQKQ